MLVELRLSTDACMGGTTIGTRRDMYPHSQKIDEIEGQENLNATHFKNVPFGSFRLRL